MSDWFDLDDMVEGTKVVHEAALIAQDLVKDLPKPALSSEVSGGVRLRWANKVELFVYSATDIDIWTGDSVVNYIDIAAARKRLGLMRRSE